MLPDELDRCFNELCPASQTWRIDALQLDVGDILLEELPRELPRRLRDSLRTALGRMLTYQHFSHGSRNGENLRIIDASALLQEFVIWFLQNGTVPWWFKGSESAMQILDEQLDSQPLSTISIIRDLGRSAIVRKRIVRQCGEARVQKIIHLLEPWEGDFICLFAENLFAAQAERQIPQAAASEYREHTWLNILTFLLVDRGSLFNTAAFVRTNLQRTAQHYQLDYRELLAQIFEAAHVLQPLGLITHVFFSSIKMIYAQDYASVKTPKIEEGRKVDPWPMLRKMLRHGVDRHTTGPDTVQVEELFNSLAQRDSDRMATLLRSEGKSSRFRQGILSRFSFDGLALLVQVLEPQHQPFIVDYVRHVQAQAELQRSDKKIVWEVVLVYLLADSSSHFNRRQLVYVTLQNLCKLYQFEFTRILDLMIHTLHEKYTDSRRFDLLDIFQDLRNEQKRQQAPANIKNPYLDAAQHYLRTGKRSSAYKARGMPAAHPELERLKALSGEKSLVALLQATELNSTSDTVLSQRLLKLAGVADLPLLFGLIEPGSADFCIALLNQLAWWRKQFWLPSLDKVDLAFHLPALLVQSLPGFRGKRAGSGREFDLAAFWQKFTWLLQQRYKVDLRLFHLQLRQCLEQGELLAYADGRLPVTSHDGVADLRLKLQSLIGEETAYAARLGSKDVSPQYQPPSNQVYRVGNVPEWSPVQLLQALRLRLGVPALPGAENVARELMALPTPEFWHSIEEMESGTVREWLERQPDKYYLLARLSREHHMHVIEHGLSPQLPMELACPDETLKHLSLLFQQSGGWHGATAMLEQLLQEIFWAVMLNATTIKLSASELLAAMMANACLRLDISLSGCLESFKDQTHLLQKKHWRDAYDLMSKATMQTAREDDRISVKFPSALQPNGNAEVALRDAEFRQDHLARYLDHPDFTYIARHLLQRGRAPSWLAHGQTIDLGRLLFDMFTFRPEQLSVLLGNLPLQPEVIFRLLNIVPFAWLVGAMHATAPNRQSIKMLYQFQQLMEQVALPNSSRVQRTAILFQLALKRWLKKDWAALEPEKLIADFLWELMRSQHHSRALLQKSLAPHLAKQPETIRLALEKAIDIDRVSKMMQREDRSPSVSQTERKLAAALKAMQEPQDHAAPIRILNSGLVILQSFIPTLFSRLGLVEDQKFVTHRAQRHAVHLLQFLVTGCRETAEEHLVLNKLLCGLALHEPVEIGIEISAEEEEVCHSLLNAAIGYWNAIGESSIEGFQGNWLVREGSLNDAGDHWDLIVEKRVYDLLLARSPFSYSVINFPWMGKAIYVTWPT